MTIKKKTTPPSKEEVKPEAKKASAPAPVPAKETPAAPATPASTPEAGTPKRMVLKTLKRAVSAPPLSPTLRKVTPGTVRRVLPKAPPPKPKPVEPPPPPPKPEVKKEPIPAPAPKAAAPTPVVTPKPNAAPASAAAPAPVAPKKVTPTASPAPAPASAPAKKPDVKSEPTATYRMPAPSTAPAPKKSPAPARPSSPAKPAVSPATVPSPAPVQAPAAAASAAVETPTARPKIKIPEVLTVKDLSEKLNVKPIDVIKKMLGLGTMVTINQQIDADTATLAADAFGTDVEIIPIFQEEVVVEEKEDPAKLKPRPPIVTIMGHVDHGKTSLLDAIRKTRVAEKEAGGITQHIGAYRVPTPKGDVVFLDTPGHEAFTAMRARGAQATDIVVLVVAADDGVMPQTIEAIDHARAAGVTIVVAVNKIDLPQASPEKIRRELSTHQLVPEDWGGKTIFVDVSAKKGTNLDKLLEMLSLEAELLELKADPDRSAQGVVVEARLDPRRGVTATLLVQKGTLKVGDIVVVGVSYGKIRAMTDDRGNRLESAGPSTPVEVLGLSAVPQAGDRFNVMKEDREARLLVERRQMVLTEQAQKRRHVTLENLHDRVAEGKIRELKIILKADVQGSVQALRDALERMSNEEIRLNVIHAGVGGINETDVALADASDAIIIGFSVRADAKSEEIARREEVSIRTYRIIYEAIADVRAAMEGLLEPDKEQVRLGSAEVRQVFRVSKVGNIAGCMVLEGKITRNSKARLLRDNVVVYEGTIEALKRFKDDAREVEKGFECGISLANFQDIKPKDIIEAYTEETKARKLETPA